MTFDYLKKNGTDTDKIENGNGECAKETTTRP